MPRSRRRNVLQHTVPASYLRAFAVDMPGRRVPSFWVYGKAGGPPRVQSPSNTFAEKHFYTMVDDHGAKDDAIEVALAQLESSASPILERWRAPGGQFLNSDGPTMMEYVSLLLTRTARHVTVLGRMRAMFLSSALRSMSRDKLRRLIRISGLDASIADLRVWLADPLKHFYPAIHEGREGVIDALEQARLLRPQLAQMYWGLCEAPPGSFFVTSDHPVSLAMEGPDPDPGTGPIPDNACLSLPISPQVALIIKASPCVPSRILDADDASEVNRRTIETAFKDVVSPYREDWIEELIREEALGPRTAQFQEAEFESYIASLFGKPRGRRP